MHYELTAAPPSRPGPEAVDGQELTLLLRGEVRGPRQQRQQHLRRMAGPSNYGIQLASPRQNPGIARLNLRSWNLVSLLWSPNPILELMINDSSLLTRSRKQTVVESIKNAR